MECFGWQNLTSDFLDQKLKADLQKKVDAHVQKCDQCGKRVQHLRLLLNTIHRQPKHPLPIPMRKSPLSASLPRLEMLGRSRWERLPWFIRTGLEGAGIAVLVLAAVALVPTLRDIYERSQERKLDDLILAEAMIPRDLDSSEPIAPLIRGGSTGTSKDSEEGFINEFPSGDTLAEEEAKHASEDPNLRVGNSQIWRFNLKTDSPKELRRKVIELLIENEIAQSTPGFGGVEAPGGIQFDILIPKEKVLDLKEGLGRVSQPPRPSLGKAAPLREPFTWYKSQSRRRIPRGEARVVIWLSQI